MYPPKKPSTHQYCLEYPAAFSVCQLKNPAQVGLGRLFVGKAARMVSCSPRAFVVSRRGSKKTSRSQLRMNEWWFKCQWFRA